MGKWGVLIGESSPHDTRGVNLNDDFDKTGDILDNYKWAWLNMGDDRVCPDCEHLATLEPVSFTEWQTDRTEPGRGDTVCQDRCRCVFYPVDLFDNFTDLKASGKIVIQDEGNLIIDQSVPYEAFHELDGLIVQYKNATNGLKLPPKYFEIESVYGRIEFLEHWLEGVR